jgi:hypothetical protein
MRRIKKRHAAIGMLMTGVLTISSGFALESTASADNPNEDCPAGTVEVARFEWKGEAYVAENNTGGVVILPGSDTEEVDWTSTVTISDIIIKGATGTDSVHLDPAATSGSFTNEGLPDNNGGNTPAISHIQFCHPTGSSSSSSSVSSSSVSSSSTSQTTSSVASSSTQQTSSAEVSGSSQVNTSSEAPASEVTSSAEVSGIQIPRALPRTGIDPGFLLMLGGMLLVSGVLLLRYADDTATA